MLALLFNFTALCTPHRPHRAVFFEVPECQKIETLGRALYKTP